MAKPKPPPSGPGSRPDQFEKKLADYTARKEKSKHSKEITGEIQSMLDNLDLEGVHKLRDAKKGGGRWTKQQQLAKSLTDEELVEAYAGKPSEIRTAFKTKDISVENVEFAYGIITEPFVWMFRLPVLSVTRVKKFAHTFIRWAHTHIPGGLPLLDHAILLAAFITPLADAGKRKANGEAAKYPKKSATPETPKIPDGIDQSGDPNNKDRGDLAA